MRSTTRFFAALCSMSLFLASCGVAGSGGSGTGERAPDPRKVVAHSAGLLPPSAAIRVVLAEARGETGAALDENPFSFEPALRGSASWEDERTLLFQPEGGLEPGRAYRVTVDLGRLGAGGAAGTAAAADRFDFGFRVAERRLAVELGALEAKPDGSLALEGRLTLSDGADPRAVERVLAAAGPAAAGAGKELLIEWGHESETVHRFAVKGIARGAVPGELRLRWDGRPAGSPSKGSEKLRLPPAGAFELLGARSTGAPGEALTGGLELAFSEALARGQDLRGLVSVEGVGGEELRAEAEGSRLRLYAPAWPASAKIRVEPGLRASSGARLETPVAATVDLGWQKPALRFLSAGVILPTSQGLTVPIETLNLDAVVVEAFRVYSDNMLQFLQVNELDSSRELRRVGELVFRTTLDLGWRDDWKNRWVRTGLDLGPLLARHQDGMFQIRLTFRRNHSRYVCPNDHDFGDLEFPEARYLERNDGEYSFWDYVEQWPEGYDDYERYKDDPCHPAFYLPSYSHDVSARRNVIISDLGAIARRESSGAWTVAVSDLRSAVPLPGATVSLYSFQRRLLAEAVTGADGMVRLEPATGAGGGGSGVALSGAEPAFGVVARGAQRSWLKLDAGSSLAVGHFDVGGEKADDGVKGFIYGERGVWRPGDPIHLTFALYDRAGTLPQGHPILFELEDPQGRIVQSFSTSNSLNGFYAIEASTNRDAPTGPYLARVKLGGRSFTKRVRVETVMPNRLKIKLSWDGPAYLSAEPRKVRFESAWLTGARAGALEADVSASFASVPTAFTSFTDYVFDDPTRQAPSDRVVLFKGRLGDEGSTDFLLDLEPRGAAPGKLRADLLARVFEPTGVFSSESSSVELHPYAQYVGLKLPKGDAGRGMLLTDVEHRVQLALVDREGRPIPSGTVEVALYQLEWRWWWEKGEESLAETAEDLYARPLKSGQVRISNGKGEWAFSVKHPNWGRFLVRVQDRASGHAAAKIVYIDWPGWAGRGRGEAGGAGAALSLEATKPGYAVGERVQVAFPSNEGGRALVAIERAGRLLRQEWVEGRKDRTVYEFAATPDMAPNVYVHVSFLQPHLQTANDLPIRLYGIVPIAVEDPASRLTPIVEAPAELRPNSRVAFAVREAAGRPMTCTVAVVDEGLLGITKFQTPDPRAEFSKKEASALASWDLYQYVAGAYSGKLETLLAVGGSDDALGGGQRKPSRFPPVVYYFPPFEVGAGQRVEKSFELGPYVGAVRFMVVAGPAGPPDPGASPPYGFAEREVPVRSPLMAQMTAPRVLSPGEEAAIPATVFSFLGKRRVRVSLAASGSLELAGAGESELDFQADGDRVVAFRVRALDKPGPGKLLLSASADGEGASQAIELEVRSLGVPVTTSKSIVIEAGATWRGEIGYPGAPGSNAATLEASRLPSLNLGERLDWLIAYPHGCAEQTVSRAYPQLFLPEAVGLGADRLEEVRSNVRLAIDRMPRFQRPSGGFAFWPGYGEEDPWLSAYVLDFLIKAGRAGYEVDQALLADGLGYLARSARAWNSYAGWSKSVQAYRLYVLALAGRPELGAMNRFREQAPFPGAARYRLAAAYALTGQARAAQELLRDGESPDLLAAFEGLEEYAYGTPLRERANALEALTALGMNDRAFLLYREVAEALATPGRLSTQELGAALSACLPFAARASKAGPVEIRLSRGQEPASTIRLERPTVRLDLDPGRNVRESLAVENRGTVPVYLGVVARGVPAMAAERPVSSGLSLALEFLDMEGAGIDPERLPVGTDFIVEARVSNLTAKALKNLALSHRLPSGWEILNYRAGEELPADEEEGAGRQEPSSRVEPLYDYQDVRDDRVLTYFSLQPRAEKIFRLYVNKTYEGRFYLPAVAVEAMYDSRLQAIVPGRWLAEAFSGRFADPVMALPPDQRKKNR